MLSKFPRLNAPPCLFRGWVSADVSDSVTVRNMTAHRGLQVLKGHSEIYDERLKDKLLRADAKKIEIFHEKEQEICGKMRSMKKRKSTGYLRREYHM